MGKFIETLKAERDAARAKAIGQYRLTAFNLAESGDLSADDAAAMRAAVATLGYTPEQVEADVSAAGEVLKLAPLANPDVIARHAADERRLNHEADVFNRATFDLLEATTKARETAEREIRSRAGNARTGVVKGEAAAKRLAEIEATSPALFDAAPASATAETTHTGTLAGAVGIA